MNRIWKSALYGLLIAVVLCGIGIGFQKKIIVVSQIPTPVAQVQDVAGTEARDRLLRQQKELNNGQTLANDRLDLANARLDNEIAKLQGKQQHPGKVAVLEAKVNADEAAGYDTNWHGLIDLSSKSAMMDSLTIMALFMDCNEAIIEKHNAAFPKDPWATMVDVRDKIGGAPGKERQEVAATCAVDGNLAAAIRKKMQKEW